MDFCEMKQDKKCDHEEADTWLIAILLLMHWLKDGVPEDVRTVDTAGKLFQKTRLEAFYDLWWLWSLAKQPMHADDN